MLKVRTELNVFYHDTVSNVFCLYYSDRSYKIFLFRMYENIARCNVIGLPITRFVSVLRVMCSEDVICSFPNKIHTWMLGLARLCFMPCFFVKSIQQAVVNPLYNSINPISLHTGSILHLRWNPANTIVRVFSFITKTLYVVSRQSKHI